MPIGRPDWYNAGLSENIASLDDMGELAVRLGSMVNFDRTGKVIYGDDFTRFDGLWRVVSLGLTFGPAVDTVIAEYGGSSLKTTIGIGATNYVNLTRYTRTWINSKVSLETSLYLDTDPNEVVMYCNQIKDNTLFQAALKLDTNSTKLYYLDSSNNFTLLKTYPYRQLYTDFFTTIKMDLDYTVNQYTRFRINSDTVDLAGLAIREVGTVYLDCSVLALIVMGNAASALNLYIDRVIFSEDQ